MAGLNVHGKDTAISLGTTYWRIKIAAMCSEAQPVAVEQGPAVNTRPAVPPQAARSCSAVKLWCVAAELQGQLGLIGTGEQQRMRPAADSRSLGDDQAGRSAA